MAGAAVEKVAATACGQFEMGNTTILLCLGAGVSITLAAVCWIMWLMDRRAPESLALFLLGVGVAGSAGAELHVFHSASVAEFGEGLRWMHVPIFLFMLGQVLFAYYYLRSGRLWLVWTIIVARSILLLVNFSVEPNINFSSIGSLRQVLLLGEPVTTIGAAVPRAGWQGLAVVSIALIIAFLVDAVVQRWRLGGRESKRKALVIALGVLCPQLCSAVYSQLVVFGVVRGLPISGIPWFLSIQVLMAYEVGRDFIISKHATVKLAELQSRFAHAERISQLGQLASSLAHELAQPLSANAINTHTALKQLEGENVNVERLRAILRDIDSDTKRSTSLLIKMRQLFKRRDIEMQPLRIQDVVQDAIVLVGPELNRNEIALSLLIQPDLPPVSGDRVHLSQVLLNLLINSIHAVQSCAPHARRIVVEARKDDEKHEVEVSVRDTGHGISDDNFDQIFGPFFTTKVDGMGMGLSLSRTIIEVHGGRLWADRLAKQDGCVFRFTLQRA
jgi:signal transduction histidine kinase